MADIIMLMPQKIFINARGPAAETIDHLIIAFEEGKVDEQLLNVLRMECEACMKMIKVINWLRNKGNPNL